MATEPASEVATASNHAGNRYDRMEWAGAFGELGTLIPFVVAYISVLKLDPFGVLFAFGLSMLVCGLYYKTPFPVQPMKAIGAVASIQAVQTALVTPAAVYSAALATGVIWLLLGLSGLMARVARLVPASVVIGIVLGLGFGFMLQGIKMMQTDWVIAIIGATGTLLLMGNRTLPAMFVLLAFGAVVGGIQHPELLTRLSDASIGFRTPTFALTDITWNQVFVGVVLLASPQIPLTLGNAVIAVTDDNNRLFGRGNGQEIYLGDLSAFGFLQQAEDQLLAHSLALQSWCDRHGSQQREITIDLSSSASDDFLALGS